MSGRGGPNAKILPVDTKLPVIWSPHALERAAERVGFDPDIPIPVRKIQMSGSRRRNRQRFRVQTMHATFICERRTNRIVVVTVYTGAEAMT